MTGIEGIIRRHSRLVVTVVGLWFAFVFFYVVAATDGAVFGLPLHLIGATFFFVLLALKLMGDSSSKEKSSSGSANTGSSGSGATSIPGIGEIMDTGSSSLGRLQGLRDHYSNRPPENQGSGPTRTGSRQRGQRAQRSGTESDERDNGLDAMLDTEIAEDE